MATPAFDFSQLAKECEKEGLTPQNGQRIGAELAKAFNVRADEIGILRRDKQTLVFVYPPKLHTVGTIPLNTAGSVAARTATSKRAEIVNNFAQQKHTSLFEAVELEDRPKPQAPPLGKPRPAAPAEKTEKQLIQKLMSAPVVGAAGVLGVIQVSRKGTSAATAGPDFTPADLKRLVTIATSLAACFR